MALSVNLSPRPARSGSRGVARLKEMSSYEARQQAELIVRRGSYSELQQRAVQSLVTFGVMPVPLFLETVALSDRTLRKYRAQRLVDVVEAPLRLRTLLGERKLRAVILGPVGEVLGEMEQEIIPRGYVNAPQDRLSHDLLCSIVTLRIGVELQALGWQDLAIRGRYEATVHDGSGRPKLEPDALIEGRTPSGERRLFVIEYHHEDFASRAVEKLSRYEELWRGALVPRWQERWQTREQPTVLVVWTHRAVGRGYQEEINGWRSGRGLKGRYLGRPLRSFLGSEGADAPTEPVVWRDFIHEREGHLVESG